MCVCGGGGLRGVSQRRRGCRNSFHVYKMDQQLFRRSTRNACDVRIHKEEFADDVALLASTREAAGIAVRVYMEVDKILWVEIEL